MSKSKRILVLTRPLCFFLFFTIFVNVWVFFSAAYGALTMLLTFLLEGTSYCTVIPAIVELTTPFLTKMFLAAFLDVLWLIYILRCNKWRLRIFLEFFVIFVICLIILSIPFFIFDYWSVKYTVQATDSFLKWNFTTLFNFTPRPLKGSVRSLNYPFVLGNTFACSFLAFFVIFTNRIFFSHFISIRYSDAVRRNFPFFYNYFLGSYRWFFFFLFSDGDSFFRAFGSFIVSLIYYAFNRIFFYHPIKYSGILYHKGYIKSFFILFPIFFFIHYILVFFGTTVLYLFPLAFIFIFVSRIIFVGIRSLYFNGIYQTFNDLCFFLILNTVDCPRLLLKFIVYYNPYKIKRPSCPSGPELGKVLNASKSYSSLFALIDKTKADFCSYPNVITSEATFLRKWRLIRDRENFRSAKKL